MLKMNIQDIIKEIKIENEKEERRIKDRKNQALAAYCCRLWRGENPDSGQSGYCGCTDRKQGLYTGL
jgi:hypothetical protein